MLLNSVPLDFISYIVHVLGQTNPQLCVSENVIVLYLCKTTELGQKRLKVEIIYNFKEF